MLRTTFYLPEKLHQRIKKVSKKQEKSASELLREILKKELPHLEQADVSDSYAAFEKLKGAAGNDDIDASKTIDDLLYGKKGAWRGSEK